MHQVHLSQVSAWKRQAVDGLDDVFSSGSERRLRDREPGIKMLHAMIGELMVERYPATALPSLPQRVRMALKLLLHK